MCTWWWCIQLNNTNKHPKGPKCEPNISICTNILLANYNKKAPLRCNIFRTLLASRSMSDLCLISRMLSFILRYLCVVFPCAGNIRVWVHIGCHHSAAEDSARTLCDRGRRGQGRAGGGKKKLLRCAREINPARNFTALCRGPIPGLGPVPGSAGDWGDELCGSCGSTILWPRMWSGC